MREIFSEMHREEDRGVVMMKNNKAGGVRDGNGGFMADWLEFGPNQALGRRGPSQSEGPIEHTWVGLWACMGSLGVATPMSHLGSLGLTIPIGHLALFLKMKLVGFYLEGHKTILGRPNKKGALG